MLEEKDQNVKYKKNVDRSTENDTKWQFFSLIQFQIDAIWIVSGSVTMFLSLMTWQL